MMGIRLLELHRVLKPAGSVYLHCDPTASHYLKASMDAVFGKANFRNELIWHYQAGTKGKKYFGRKHDIIFWYAKTSKAAYNRIKKPVVDESRYNRVDADGRRYHVNGVGKKYYLDEGASCDDVWTWTQEKQFQQLNSQSKERTGWKTQKPLALLQRIIKASSNEGDLVLDPFAGCATACEAAEIEGRQWIGIEACEAGADIIKLRLDKADLGHLGTLEDILSKVSIRYDIPIRTDPEGIALAKKRKTKAYKTEDNFDYLYGKQRGHCLGCTEHFQSKHLTFDHKTPQAKDGSHELENLQLLCGPCNSIKGDDTMEDLKRRLKERDEQKLAKLERMGLTT